MKSWAPLTGQPKEGYNQVSSGESHGGNTGGKFVPGKPSGEYRTNTSGESHSGSPSGKFLSGTKGNKDLPPNHTKNTPQGRYSGD